MLKDFAFIYSTESDDSSEDEFKSSAPNEHTRTSSNNSVTYMHLLPSMKQVYGVDIRTPSHKDIHLYRRYASMACSSTSKTNTTSKRVMIPQKSAFPVDNTLQVTTPFVGKSSLNVYIDYWMRGHKVAPSSSDALLYRKYVTGRRT